VNLLNDWWEELFEQMLKVSLHNLIKIEELQDGSIEAATLLMEAADNYNFLQQAYHDKCSQSIHVEFILTDG
tara:strand:+ start:413 stop:628 length:216 start_codon:yes stop_codon:yes gene_type:complete